MKSTFEGRSPRRSAPGFRSVLGAGAVALALVAGCGGSSGGGSASHTPGTIIAGANGLKLIVDDNQGGQADKLHILSVEWGRLVDLKDFDPLTSQSNTIFSQIVVRDDIDTQGSFQLDQDAVTGRQVLTILHPFGTPNFDAALQQALHLQQVLSKSLDVSELPPFTALPRNSAALITFDDLLSPSTIKSSNFKVLTGYTPTSPFEARVIADANHGDKIDFDGNGAKVYSTRVIVDMTVSQDEAAQSNPPLVPNSIGLPAATVVTQPNVAFRLPTKTDFSSSQFDVLRNLNGKALGFTGNGPNDPFSPTLDLVRAMRSMGAANVTGDPNNGFLSDHIPPQVLGKQGVTVVAVPDGSSTNPDDFLVDLGFSTLACAQIVRVGDVVVVNSARATATAISSPPINGVVLQAKFRLNTGSNSAAFLAGGIGEFNTSWDPTLGVPPACFVQISPTPNTMPASGVSTDATFSVQFSEPIDPGSVQPFDSLRLSRTGVFGGALHANVAGVIQPSVDVTAFTFRPGNATTAIPLGHSVGTAETYNLNVGSGANGVTDLAGNALAIAFPAVPITLEPTQPLQNTDAFVLRFNSTDEDVPVFNGVAVNFATPEVRGQLLFDLNRGVVMPRPVTRFSSIADGHINPVIGIMALGTAPIQTPLSNLGSKLMAVWRYHDLNLGLLDEATMNLDVEGLSWSPFSNGGVIVDQFPQFQISLAHSEFLPDEIPNLVGGPALPTSGLVQTFDSNLLDPVNDPLFPIHPKSYGYVVSPTDTFLATTGTQLQPWPINRQLPAGKARQYYTYRDTTIQALGGPNGAGADTSIFQAVTGTGATIYKTGVVPSIGLPLLMEFRCYPNDSALGLNNFQIATALTTSAAPFFRAFSTGGISQSGSVKKVDPDNENLATGGIDPATGFSTGPLDNDVYFGQADFVVRVSRMHTIWFDTGFGSPHYFDPIVLPESPAQPAGTQVVIAYRGATAISNAPSSSNNASWINANNIDFYGESKALLLGGSASAAYGVTFNPVNDKTWKSSTSSLTGSRLFQARVSFISNVDTGLSPVLNSLAFPYQQ